MNERRQELDERVADDERHAATMRKARDYDDLLARAEAAEALAYERLESALFAEQRATDLEARVAELEAALGGLDALASDYDLPDGEAVAMAISDGRILTAGRRNIHGAVMGVMDVNRDNEALRARVAELESQLAAQQWRPVTEDWPPYGVEHLGRGMLNSPTLLVTRTTDDSDEVWQDSDGMLFYYAREIRYCAAIPEARPLPPAPQETE